MIYLPNASVSSAIVDERNLTIYKAELAIEFIRSSLRFLSVSLNSKDLMSKFVNFLNQLQYYHKEIEKTFTFISSTRLSMPKRFTGIKLLSITILLKKS
jgi:hypothetical protein